MQMQMQIQIQIGYSIKEELRACEHSLHLAAWSSYKRTFDKYRIDCGPRALPIIDLRKQSNQAGKVETIWTQKLFDLDTKSIWFGHKIYLIRTQELFVQPWDSFNAELVFDVLRIHLFYSGNKYLSLLEIFWKIWKTFALSADSENQNQANVSNWIMLLLLVICIVKQRFQFLEIWETSQNFYLFFSYIN